MDERTPDPKRYGRSRLTNGRLFADLHGVDGRGSNARRLRDLMQQFEAKLGYVDETARILIRRAAALCVLCEEWDDEIAGKTGKVDLTEYAKATSALYRLLKGLGLTKAGAPPAEDSNALLQYLYRKGSLTDAITGEGYGFTPFKFPKASAAPPTDGDDDDDDYKPRRVVTAKKVKRRASRYRADDDEED